MNNTACLRCDLRSASALVLTLACLFAPDVAFGQDFDRYRPKSPVPQPNVPWDAQEPKEATGDEKVLVKELKVLVFVDRPEAVTKEQLHPQDFEYKVTVRSERGLELLRSAEMQRLMQPYLGGPVSIRRLNELARDVILLYRRHDLPVVDVSIPDQDIADGVIQIVVVEGRVGRVRVEGTRYFNPCMLLGQVDTQPGRRIYESRIQDDLDWLNRNPFRRVETELRPGDAFGETDIIFKVKDRLPLRGYVGYEDTGTQATGIERTIYGFNLGNCFGRDHQLGYQYSASSDFHMLSAHSVNYGIPLWNRDTLLFYGSYATIASAQAVPLNQTGLAWQASVRYNHTLEEWGTLTHGLTAGFDFKQTNTNLDLGGTSVFASSADIAQMAFGYYARKQHTLGTSAFGADLFLSPGGFSPGNSDADFNTIRAGATANYIYMRSFLERQVQLPNRLILYGRLTGQAADHNLLPNEELGFGGYDTIRGYDQRQANGDLGYIANVELRTSPISTRLSTSRNPDQLQVLTFVDGGQAFFHSPQPGQVSHLGLASTGLGARYSWGSHVQARADYGWQLHELVGSLGTQHSRIHLGIVISR